MSKGLEMKRIFLLGYMGAGKTTVGKLLAKRMNLSFIDLDFYIEGRYRKKISDLFTVHGEDGFRQIEQRMLKEVAEFEDVLVSTGGGTPCFFHNMDFMNQKGTTVYLKVSVNELASRLETCKQTRPVLKNRSGEDLKKFISDSLEGRRAFYEKAQIHFEAEQMMTEKDISVIVDDLMNLL